MEGLVAIWYDREKRGICMLRASLQQHPRHAMLIDEVIAQVLYPYLGVDPEAMQTVVNTAALYAAISNALPVTGCEQEDAG